MAVVQTHLLRSLIPARPRSTPPLNQNLLNDFLRYIYIPLIMAGSSPKKIIRSLSALPKKPTDEVTMVVDARAEKATDLARTAINIMRYCRMVEEGISPKSLICLVSTHNLTH